MTQNGTPTDHAATILEVAARLGVPTFVLVVLLLTLMPRIDRGLDTLARVDVQLGVLIDRCGGSPPPAAVLLPDQPPT